MTAAQIRKIHATRTAREGKLYYDDIGRVFIGTEKKMLKLYQEVVQGDNIVVTNFRGKQTISSEVEAAVENILDNECCNSILKTVVEKAVPVGTIDGANDTFTLPFAPVDQNSTFLYIDGKWQTKSDYSLIGNQIVFTTPPALGSLLFTIYLRADLDLLIIPNGEIPGGLIDGSNTVFSPIYVTDDLDSLIVTLNGLTQTCGVDFVASGAYITFTVPPALGSTIYVYGDSIFPSVAGISFIQEPLTGLVDNVNTVFTTSAPPIWVDGTVIGLDGNTSEGAGDFSLSGNTITFVSAPALGSELYIFYSTYSSNIDCCELNIRHSAVDTVATVDDYAISVNAASGNRVVTLPLAAQMLRKELVVMKTDTSGNYVRIQTTGGEFLGSGVATLFDLLFQDENLSFISTGTRFRIT